MPVRIAGAGGYGKDYVISPAPRCHPSGSAYAPVAGTLKTKEIVAQIRARHHGGLQTLDLPILDLKAGGTLELIQVVGDQRQPARNRLASDEDVIGPDVRAE
jgi:hypothetical protein